MNTILDLPTWQLFRAMHSNCNSWDDMVAYALNMLRLAEESGSDSLKWSAIELREHLVSCMKGSKVELMSYADLQLILWDRLN